MDGSQWAILLISWIGLTILFLAVKGILGSRLRALKRRRIALAGDVVGLLFERTRAFFLIIVALYFAVNLADAGPRTQALIGSLTVIAFAVQGILWGNALINFYLARYREQKLEEDAAAVMSMQAVGILSRLVLYSIVLLLALENLGIDITALVAGLGIGGIAVALAVQNVLGDLFASLSIVLDKPFVVGDFLVIDEFAGVVERVGLKTTRVRSLAGEQLVFSNSDLLESRIRNYKRMFERRIVFKIEIQYETPREKLPQVSKWLEEIVRAQEKARFDRAHFLAFGDYALVYEVVYYVLSPDYNTYMDIQQSINLAILDRFHEGGVEFAYPTQTIHAHVAGDNGSQTVQTVVE